MWIIRIPLGQSIFQWQIQLTQLNVKLNQWRYLFQTGRRGTMCSSTNMYDHFTSMVRTSPKITALLYDDLELTFEDLGRVTHNLADKLSGFRHIVICLPPSDSAICTMLAAWKLGTSRFAYALFCLCVFSLKRTLKRWMMLSHRDRRIFALVLEYHHKLLKSQN